MEIVYYHFENNHYVVVSKHRFYELVRMYKTQRTDFRIVDCYFFGMCEPDHKEKKLIAI